MSDLRQMPLFNADPQTVEDLNKHTSLRATLALFEQHLRKEGKSIHTIKAFTSDLTLVGEFLSSATPIGEFTTTNLNKFLDWLEYGRGVPCSRKSYARRVTTLKVYFKWLRGVGAIPHDPAKAVLQRSGPAPLSEALSMKQIRTVIEHAQTLKYKRTDEQDYRPELLFRLLLDTGIKKSEAMKMVPADIDRTNPHLPVLTVRHKSRNVYRERRIELDSDWVKLLDLYLDQYKPKDTIFNCTSRNLEYILSDLGEGAGIPFKLSFEIMRWTCGVRDFRLGMDEPSIREKMGLSETSWSETGKKIRMLSERLARESEANRSAVGE